MHNKIAKYLEAIQLINEAERDYKEAQSPQSKCGSPTNRQKQRGPTSRSKSETESRPRLHSRDSSVSH